MGLLPYKAPRSLRGTSTGTRVDTCAVREVCIQFFGDDPQKERERESSASVTQGLVWFGSV